MTNFIHQGKKKFPWVFFETLHLYAVKGNCWTLMSTNMCSLHINLTWQWTARSYKRSKCLLCEMYAYRV